MGDALGVSVARRPNSPDAEGECHAVDVGVFRKSPESRRQAEGRS